MNLNLDFDYLIPYIPYRHQNPNIAYGRSSVEIQIKELSASEIPLVAKVASGRFRSDDLFSFKADNSPRELRFKEGRFFIERHDIDTFLGAIEGDWKDTVFRKEGIRKPSYLKYTTADGLRSGEVLGRPHRSIEDDGGEKKANTLSMLSGRLVIVDNVVFEEVAEPVFSFSHGEVGIDSRGQPSFRTSNIYDEDSIFSLYSYHDATSNLNVDIRTLLPEGAVEYFPHVEVYDPSVFTYDGDTRNTFKKVVCLYASLASSPERLPLPMLQAWVDLRDAYEEANGRVTARLLDSVKSIREVQISPEEIRRIRIRMDRNVFMTKTAPIPDIEGYIEKADDVLNCWRRRDPYSVWEIEGPLSRLDIDGYDVFELGSKGDAIDCCRTAGMSFDDARSVADSGKRILISMNPKASTKMLVALLNDDNNVEIVSPIEVDDCQIFIDRFNKYVQATDEAKSNEAELSSVNINFIGLGR